MTQQEAREKIEQIINDHCIGDIDNIGWFKLPEKDEVVFIEFKDVDIYDWTFKGLLCLAYNLKEK